MEQWLQVLPDIALFVEVGRTGSFRLAAARLGVPPSTLSPRIAAQEAKMLSDAQVTQFRTRGFVHGGRIYSDEEADALRARLFDVMEGRSARKPENIGGWGTEGPTWFFGAPGRASSSAEFRDFPGPSYVGTCSA